MGAPELGPESGRGDDRGSASCRGRGGPQSAGPVVGWDGRAEPRVGRRPIRGGRVRGYGAGGARMGCLRRAVGGGYCGAWGGARGDRFCYADL